MTDNESAGPGTTEPAGAGITDDEMVEQVGGQTASDLKHEDFFERESDGATTETEAAKADADEVAGGDGAVGGDGVQE